MTADFSRAFSRAFSGDHANLRFGSGSPVTGGIAGKAGDIWVDRTVLPHAAYAFEMPESRWVLIGVFAEAVSRVSSHRLWEACLLLALRNYQIMNAPLGLSGGSDLGAVYVGRIDRDYARLVKGYRASGVPLTQQWPTVDDVASRMAMSAATAKVVDLQRAIDAAVEEIFVDVGRTWGVG